jgi:cellulose biosynthesis protein BcsQ
VSLREENDKKGGAGKSTVAANLALALAAIADKVLAGGVS